jgi:hypothetical protein
VRLREPVPPQLAAVLAALLFLAVRIALLLARPPFFDELYTLWMARQPFRSIVPHLLHDSGPPLYYFLARLPSVDALRWLSLAFASIAFALLLKRRFFLAAALLALYPPAAWYAAEARAYALCGLLVGIGVLLWDDERPFAAAIALVLAAYAHDYGALFFPVLLTKGRRGALAFAAAVVLFAPGVALALHQPPEAMAWHAGQPLFAPLYNLSFAGWWSPILPSLPVAFLAIFSLAVALMRSWRFAPAVLIPSALAIVLALAGRPVYFPVRFESVVAVPLMLWAATSLERWTPKFRATVVILLLFIGGGVLWKAVEAEASQPPPPCTRAVEFAAHAPAIVASDYCYLVAATQLGPRVLAFPPEQAQHPGWYTPPAKEAALAAARSLPANGFVFIGDAFTPELAAVQQVRRVQLLFRDGPTVVLSVEPRGLTSTVH